MGEKMNHRIEKYLAIATVTPIAGAVTVHADTFFQHYGEETPFLTLSVGANGSYSGRQAFLTTSLGSNTLAIHAGVALDSMGNFEAGIGVEHNDFQEGAFQAVPLDGPNKGIARLDSNVKLPVNTDSYIDEGKLAFDDSAAFDGEGEQRGYAAGLFILGTDLDDLNPDWITLAWFDIGVNHDTNTLTIYDWAWSGVSSDYPHPPILYTGQTEASTPVPGPAGIMALAAGAAGIRRRRQRAS